MRYLQSKSVFEHYLKKYNESKGDIRDLDQFQRI
jgi:hypothetical protein